MQGRECGGQAQGAGYLIDGKLPSLMPADGGRAAHKHCSLMEMFSLAFQTSGRFPRLDVFSFSDCVVVSHPDTFGDQERHHQTQNENAYDVFHGLFPPPCGGAIG